jgi:hypothetical protein
MLSWNTKIILYKVLVRSVALLAYRAWTATKTDEKKPAYFELKDVRRIFGLKRDVQEEHELKKTKN